MASKKALALYGGAREQIQAGDWVDIASVLWPPRYVVGCNLTWVSTSSISVSPGAALASSGFLNVTLTSPTTISTASGSYGASGGMDYITQAGTLATTNASAAVVGTGTAFTTAFNNITTSGTVSNSGGTTVTGVGTKFLTEYAINDLIGTTALGFVQVTAIATDTSLTTQATTPGGALVAATPVKCEQPLIQCGAQAIRRVIKITDNTHLTMGANSGTTVGSLTFNVGGLYPGDGATNAYYHTYLIVPASTGVAGVLLSSQRTAPLANIPAATAYRRIGSVMADTASLLTNFSQWGDNNHRFYRHEFNIAANLSRIATGTNPTTWTTYQGSRAAPPTAAALMMNFYNVANGSLRPANNGGGSDQNPIFMVGVSTGAAISMSVKCDGAQQIQAINATGGSLFLDLGGWEDIV